jgi:hypothetical protein
MLKLWEDKWATETKTENENENWHDWDWFDNKFNQVNPFYGNKYMFLVN